MTRLTIRILIIAVVAVMLAAPAQAQQSYRTFKEWYGWFHMGYVWPQGDFGDIAKSDWTVGGGASFAPHDVPVSFDFGLDFQDNRFKDIVADEFDSDKGNVEIWSFSAGLRWEQKTISDTSFYVKGGLSYNWVDARVSNVVWIPGWVCDPWYWWLCAPGWIPGETVNARYSTNDWGYYGGVGVNFETSPTSSVYIEATYRVIKTEIDTQYMPLIFGFRF